MCTHICMRGDGVQTRKLSVTKENSTSKCKRIADNTRINLYKVSRSDVEASCQSNVRLFIIDLRLPVYNQ